MSQDVTDLARRPSQGRFGSELAVVVVVVVALGVLLDRTIMPLVEPWLVAAQAVDVQSPQTLYAKLDYLRRQEGTRVALVGDSVILGLCLREHGDSDWQRHGLTALVRARLAAEQPGRPAHVLNLGFNGALPADLAEVGRLLQPVRPDLVIADIGMRGFSADFAAPESILSRSWLARLHMGDDGSCRLEPAEATWESHAEAMAEGWLLTHWKLFRLRDLIQHAVFDGSPSTALARIQKRLDRRDAPSADDQEMAELSLLLSARARFATVSLDPAHPQRRGLEAFLAHVRDAGWPTLLFYTRENPAVRDSLIEPATYDRLHEELRVIVRPYASSRFRFHAGLESLSPIHYLDHLHVDAEGYQALFDALWPHAQALLMTASASNAGR